MSYCNKSSDFINKINECSIAVESLWCCCLDAQNETKLVQHSFCPFGYRGNDSQRRRRGNVATPPGCCCVSALRWLQADANINKVVLVYWHASTILYPLSVKTPFQASLGIYWFNSILKTNKPHFPQTHLRTVSINMGQRRQNRQPKWNEVNRRLASLRVPSASTPNCGRKHWAWAEEGQRGGDGKVDSFHLSRVYVPPTGGALCLRRLITRILIFCP